MRELSSADYGTNVVNEYYSWFLVISASGSSPQLQLDETKIDVTGPLYGRKTDGSRWQRIRFPSGNVTILVGDDGEDASLSVIGTTSAPLASQVQGAGAAGAPVAGNPVLVGGTDGVNARVIATDANGFVKVTGGVSENASLAAPGPVVPVGGRQVGSGNLRALLLSGQLGTAGAAMVCGPVMQGSNQTSDQGPVIGGGLDGSGAAVRANLTDISGRQKIVPRVADWTIFNDPAGNTIATVTHGASAGQRHALTEVTVAAANAGGAASGALYALVRDGATGVGAPLWTRLLALTATNGDKAGVDVAFAEPIVGTAGNAMTVEFTTAPGATNFEQVAASGYMMAAND